MRARILTVFDECLLINTRRRLPAWRLLLYAGLSMATALWLVPGVVTRRLPFTSVGQDGHAMVSYQIALTTALCGLPSRYNPKYHPALFLAENDWASDVSAPALLAATAGSVETYCSTSTVPYVNEDNSLGLLETAYLLLRPTAAAIEIGRFLSVLRFSIVAAFVTVLLSLGASVVLASGIAAVALAICLDLQQIGMAYSASPFFFALVLMNTIAFYGALRLAASGRLGATVVGAAAVGFIVSASVNMRSSYLPVYACFFVVYCAGVWRILAGAPGRTLRVACLAPAFLFGYFLFHYPLISRPARVAAASNYTYHTVSHPLVLGLALPENDLAKREGIQWSDEVGNTLARQIDPKASYLLPGYEKAMLTYYVRLWQKYPGEMAGLYLEKMKIAGGDMIQHLRPAVPWMPVVLWPLAGISNGLYLLAILMGMSGAGFVMFWRRGAGLGFCVSLLGLAGALIYLESAIILPFYYARYQNYLLFAALFVSLLSYQLALQAAINGVGWVIRAVRTPLEEHVA